MGSPHGPETDKTDRGHVWSPMKFRLFCSSKSPVGVREQQRQTTGADAQPTLHPLFYAPRHGGCRDAVAIVQRRQGAGVEKRIR